MTRRIRQPGTGRNSEAHEGEGRRTGPIGLVEKSLGLGDESLQLPVPATYVIDRDGTIRFAFVNTDYSRRAELAEVVKVLKRIAN